MAYVVQKAMDLKDQIEKKGEESQNPYDRDRLLKIGKDLEKLAKEVVEAGNDALTP